MEYITENIGACEVVSAVSVGVIEQEQQVTLEDKINFLYYKSLGVI